MIQRGSKRFKRVPRSQLPELQLPQPQFQRILHRWKSGPTRGHVKGQWFQNRSPNARLQNDCPNNNQPANLKQKRRKRNRLKNHTPSSTTTFTATGHSYGSTPVNLVRFAGDRWANAVAALIMENAGSATVGSPIKPKNPEVIPAGRTVPTSDRCFRSIGRARFQQKKPTGIRSAVTATNARPASTTALTI